MIASQWCGTPINKRYSLKRSFQTCATESDSLTQMIVVGAREPPVQRLGECTVKPFDMVIPVLQLGTEKKPPYSYGIKAQV